MNKKLFLTFTAGIFALISACSGDVTEATNNPIETAASLKVLVFDASTNTPVEGAKVTVTSMPSKPEGETKADGVATIKGVPVGSHSLLVEKTGFASVISGTSIIGDAGGNVYVANEKAEYLAIYPLTASLEGWLNYTDKAGNVVPANGFKVTFNAEDGVLHNATETVAEGKYEFTGLPGGIGTNYKLTVEGKEIDGIYYNSREISGSNLYGNSLSSITAPITMNKSNTQFVLLGCNSASGDLTIDYSLATAPSSEVTCEFSDDIDTDKFKDAFVSASSGSTVAFTREVTGNKITLTPLGGTKWRSSGNGSLNISFPNLLSVKNATLTGGSSNNLIQVWNDEDLAKVAVTGHKKTNTITATSTFVDLEWNEIKDASYRVYVKYDGDNTYSLLWLMGDPSSYITSGKVQRTYSFAYDSENSTYELGSRKVIIAIQAYNDRSNTPFVTVEVAP